MLLIFSDDQGMGDVSCYGGDIPTPNIDSIAADGVKFTQFYAASSICTPSRYGLLTGRFAHRSRDQLTGALMFMSASHRDRGIRNGEQTYVSELNEAGYSTHLVGKWHLGHGDKAFWPTAHGFDSFYGHTGGCVDFFTCRYGSIPDWYRNEKLIHPVGYATDLITKEALSILAQTAGSVERPAATDRSRVRRTPWYLHVSYNAPHFGKGWDALSGEPVNVMQPKPSDLVQVQVDGTQIRKDYAAKVIGMDRSIGQLLSALDRTGQSNNTIVIFMSDHGATQEYGGDNGGLRGAKATLFEGGIRVPCVVRWPKVIEAGTISNAVASALDWYPTLARVTGTKGSKSNLDGQLI
ncbi:MAG: sulfatase-like hydrolase/transferase, partial [Planctomycetota bacterium]